MELSRSKISYGSNKLNASYFGVRRNTQSNVCKKNTNLRGRIKILLRNLLLFRTAALAQLGISMGTKTIRSVQRYSSVVHCNENPTYVFLF